MAWGMLAKGAMGAIKGGAKKVAADKLLGRGKKKPQKPQKEGAEQEKGGALAIRPTTALMPSGPTGIVPSAGGALATIGDSGGAGGGTSAQEIALNISSKIIRVDKLLAGSLTIKKNAREQARIGREKGSKKKQEAALEKSKPKEAKGLKLKLPGKSILEKIFGFFGAVILGRIAMLAVDWLPKLLPIIDTLGKWADNVVKWSGMLLDGLTRFIDWSYNLYDKAAGWVKNQFGDEAAEKFTTFMGNVKELVKAFLVWKLIGEKIFKAIVSSIRNVWSVIRGAIVKVARVARGAFNLAWKALPKRARAGVRLARMGAKRFGKNLLRGGGVKARRLIGRGGRQLLKRSGSVVKGVQKGASSLMKKGAGGLARRASLKFFGKAATKMFGKIPIFGPLIVGIVSLLSGEPLGQALFKTIGAAVGGALGTFIPIPIIGTMLGEIVGAFVGDLLYYTIVKRDPKKAVEVLKQAVGGIFRGGKAVFNFVTGGFGRFFEGIPKIKIPNFPEDPPGIMKRVPFAGKVWKGLKVAMKVMLGPIGLLMGKEIPNLLWMYNPANTGPLLVKSFFPPSGEESSGKSAPLEEKQEKKLLATNQKSGAQGVIDSISNRASYEDPTPTTVKVSPSGGSSVQSDTGKGSSPATVIPVAVGSGHDAYEPLDFFG